MWLGIDDTDGPAGGCTTFVLTEVVRAAHDLGVDLVGEPRLVRLNPNVPWKTRGNGALAARFGRGRGPRRRLASIGDETIWSFGRGEPLSPALSDSLVDAAWAAVRRESVRALGTEPAMVAARRPLPAQLYWDAVRTIVSVGQVRRLIDRVGGTFRTVGPENGIVGAAAAIAWPGRRASWELLAYREPQRIGTPRRVEIRSVRAAQAADRRLFLCYDRRTRRLLVAPHTDCPILFGLRATAVSALRPAARRVRAEPVERWMIFRTNQGTGDHVARRTAGPPGAFEAARLRGRVANAPERLRGGHVRFELEYAPGRTISCLAFEPTKTLPEIARSLRPGDQVELWGGRGEDPSFRVEGIALRTGYRPRTLGPRPICPECRHRTESRGTMRGFRCPHCRRRLPPESRVSVIATPLVAPGIYHPTPSARRHLAPRGPEPSVPVTDL